MAPLTPSTKASVKGPKVCGQARRRAVRAPRGALVTRAFWGASLACTPRKAKQGDKPSPPKGGGQKGRSARLQPGRSPPGSSRRGPRGPASPAPLRGELGPSTPKPSRSCFSLPDHQAERVWPAPPRSSPSSPGQLAGRQSVPNSVHTQRLPAPAGSSSRAGQEVWPPPRNIPTRSAPRTAGAVQVEVLTPGSWQDRYPSQGSAPDRGSSAPVPCSSSLAFGAPRSEKPENQVSAF